VMSPSPVCSEVPIAGSASPAVTEELPFERWRRSAVREASHPYEPAQNERHRAAKAATLDCAASTSEPQPKIQLASSPAIVRA
jgi:hypothetical protein